MFFIVMLLKLPHVVQNKSIFPKNKDFPFLSDGMKYEVVGWVV